MLRESLREETPRRLATYQPSKRVDVNAIHPESGIAARGIKGSPVLGFFVILFCFSLPYQRPAK
ncbi:hypothetical protein FSOLCH5_003914 [Fusarium solani]